MAVFEAIAAAGHIPVFLDADLHHYGLDLDKLRQRVHGLDALVIVHTFGYPSDLDAVRSALGGRKIALIEDCAHTLLSEYRGRLTGTLTDASFFSFGVHKPAACGGGGMMVLNKPELIEAAERELRWIPAEAALPEIRHALNSWLRSLAYHRSLYGILLASPLGKWRDNDRGDAASIAAHSFAGGWLPRKIRRVNLALLESRLRDFENEIPRVAENSQKLRDLLKGAGLSVPADPPWGKWNYFLLPVRYPNAAKRDAARRFLLSRGLDTCAPFQNCARNGRFFGYESGCWQAEEAAGCVCTVPNHKWLSESEIRHIAGCLRQSLELAK